MASAEMNPASGALEATTNAKLPRDLVRMAATIAVHRGVTIADVLDPIIREPLTALSAEVGEEMKAAANKAKFESSQLATEAR